MSWGIVAFTVGGAAIGAGVGELSNAGGWKKGAMIGAAAGAGGAYATGAGAFGAGGGLAGVPGAGFMAPAGGGFLAPGAGGQVGGQVAGQTAAPMFGNAQSSLGLAGNTANFGAADFGAKAAMTGGQKLMMGMQMAGMGMSALGALGGDSGGGISNLAEKVTPDATDQALIDTANAEAVKWRGMAGKGQFYANIATPTLRAAAKNLGKTRNVVQASMMDQKASTNLSGTVSGGTAKAALRGAGTLQGAGMEGASKLADMKTEQLRNAQGYAGNVVQRERQTGLFTNQFMNTQARWDQQDKQQQGQVLGDIANMGGMMYAQYKQMQYRNANA